MSEPELPPKRCQAPRKNGSPCGAPAIPSSGRCVGHDGRRSQWSAMGGRATSRAARAGRLLTKRLRAAADLLGQVFQELRDGKIEPRAAGAAVVSAFVHVIQAGGLKGRPARQRKSGVASSGTEQYRRNRGGR